MTADRARLAARITWETLRPRRTYAEVHFPSRRARLITLGRWWLAGLAAIPASVRAYPALPPDTGAGHIIRWERSRWVIRPAGGRRSHPWVSRPLRVNRELRREERDAASDWATAILDAADGDTRR